MTLEGYDGVDRVLVSYDVRGEDRAEAVRVCRIVFGRTRVDEHGRTTVEPGFIQRPGVVWVGQSVLVVPPGLAPELRTSLEGAGARVTCARISVSRYSLEAFRRGRTRG